MDIVEFDNDENTDINYKNKSTKSKKLSFPKKTNSRGHSKRSSK